MCPACMCVHIHAQSLEMIIDILTEPSQGSLTALLELQLLGRQNMATKQNMKANSSCHRHDYCIMIIRVKGSLNTGAQELRPGEGQFYCPLQSAALYKAFRLTSSIER